MNPAQTLESPRRGHPEQGVGIGATAKVQPGYRAGATDIPLGYWMSVLYVFAIFSLATEVFLNVVGIKPYFTLIAGPFAALIMLMAGRTFVAFQNTKIAYFSTLYLVWMIFSIPFAYWRGGSIDMTWIFLSRNFPILLLIPAMVTGYARMRQLLILLGWAGFILAMLSLRYGAVNPSDGRFSVIGTSLANPNDMATHMLFLLPFCLYMIRQGGLFGLNRLAGLLAVAVLIWDVMRSGSRGALVTLAGLLLVLFIRAKVVHKIIILGIGLVGLMVASMVLPDYLVQRYLTFKQQRNMDENIQDYAVGSTMGRLYVLEKSLEYTLKYPIFGLGPGNFVPKEADETIRRGKQSAWVGTHNTYTEVSSEMGIPALIFYLGIIGSSFSAIFWVQRMTQMHKDLQGYYQIATHLLFSLGVFSFATIFSHLSYRAYMPLMAGMTITLVVVTQDALKQLAQRIPTPQVLRGGVPLPQNTPKINFVQKRQR